MMIAINAVLLAIGSAFLRSLSAGIRPNGGKRKLIRKIPICEPRLGLPLSLRLVPQNGQNLKFWLTGFLHE